MTKKEKQIVTELKPDEYATGCVNAADVMEAIRNGKVQGL